MNKTVFILLILLMGISARPKAEKIQLSLADCRRLAIENSEDIRMSDNDFRISELDLKDANKAMLPRFDASAMGIYMLPDMDMTIAELQMRGAYMAGVNVTQPIYTGGKITTGRHLAKIGKEVATLNRDKTRMEVIAEADNAYWTYLAVSQKVKLLESYHAMMDTVYSQTRIAVESGMAIENDLLRIEARRSDIEYQLQKVRNGEYLCKMSLCRVIGADFISEPVLTDTVFTINAPGTLTTDISHRPELQLLKSVVSAKQQEIKMARSDYLPTIALSLSYSYFGNMRLKGAFPGADGNYTTFSETYNDGSAMAMLSVSIPLFSWGEGSRKVKKARLNLENARLDLDKNTRWLEIETSRAARNVEDGYRMIGTAAIALRQAEENLRVMRNRYEAFMSPLTDLLDAQAQWQQASGDYIEARAQFKIYETEYLKSIGQLKFEN